MSSVSPDPELGWLKEHPRYGPGWLELGLRAALAFREGRERVWDGNLDSNAGESIAFEGASLGGLVLSIDRKAWAL